jgi:hypothetical protein
MPVSQTVNLSEAATSDDRSSMAKAKVSTLSINFPKERGCTEKPGLELV